MNPAWFHKHLEDSQTTVKEYKYSKITRKEIDDRSWGMSNLGKMKRWWISDNWGRVEKAET